VIPTHLDSARLIPALGVTVTFGARQIESVGQPFGPESGSKLQHSKRSAKSRRFGARASVWSAEACFRFAVIADDLNRIQATFP